MSSSLYWYIRGALYISVQICTCSTAYNVAYHSSILFGPFCSKYCTKCCIEVEVMILQYTLHNKKSTGNVITLLWVHILFNLFKFSLLCRKSWKSMDEAPGRQFLTVSKKGYPTSLANLRTCGPIWMASLIELCSHVTRKPILIGSHVLRTAGNMIFSSFFNI